MIFEQLEQKLDLSELDNYVLPEYPYVIVAYDSIENKLHRVIALKEIMKNFDVDISLQRIVVELKYNYLVFDAKYLYDLGYREIYYKDLAPGDTSIVYDLIVKDNL